MMTKKRLVLITGNGASLEFGMPQVDKIIEMIKEKIDSIAPSSTPVMEEIIDRLSDFLTKPGKIEFEMLYYAIDKTYQYLNLPEPSAFDEYRPKDAALLDLKSGLTRFNRQDASILRKQYLIAIASIAFDSVKTADIAPIKCLFNEFQKKYQIISATLNYDLLIDNTFAALGIEYSNGFCKKHSSPRSFQRDVLMDDIMNFKNIHLHLHGAVNWGWNPGGDFSLHEFDDPINAIKSLNMGMSENTKQTGSSSQRCAIVTGLEKMEETLSQPFFDQYWNFNSLVASADDMVIAGYGFRDRHINMTIEQFRQNRPKAKTFLVDFDKMNDQEGYHPYEWLEEKVIETKINWILGAEHSRPHDIKQVGGRPGWWIVPGAPLLKTPELYLWLGGFASFCNDVDKNGLPV